MENGVYLSPDDGDIIASGNLSANAIYVPSKYDVHLGDQNLIVVITEIVNEKIGEINDILDEINGEVV